MSATELTAAPAARRRAGLPPGPPWPKLVQTLAFILAGPRFLSWARRRYGGAVTMRTVFDAPFVMVFDPALVKEVFQGAPSRLHAGEANALLGPVLGERSVLLLDGEEHLRHRRLMLPSFHGRRMQAFRQEILDAADREIDAWPLGEPFPIMPSMQALTLRVIIRAVFGFRAADAEAELTRRLRAMIAPISRPRGILLLTLLTRVRRRAGAGEFELARAAVDEMLFEEIAVRRADPDLGQRDDVFSALLLAEDEEGQRLSDEEVRDELLTLLLAGHETTATGLAFTFDLLLHDRRVLERAREDDERYLDAVIKESLRVRPVIPGVGRVVRGEPFQLGPYTIPPGVEINPSIRMIHHRPDLYPEPAAFRPERFLGEDPPDTYTWLPFGGGTRRCLGASFAQMEMALVLRRVLERASLRAASPQRDPVAFRAITLAPRHGVRVVLDAPPQPPARSA